jgi:hypothetical protein
MREPTSWAAFLRGGAGEGSGVFYRITGMSSTTSE